MCFKLSETRLWRSWRRSVLPLVCLGLSFGALIVTLAGCYAIALSNGHLADYHDLPPISALGGKFPEQGLFIAGFVVMCLCCIVTVTFRSAQIDEAAPGHWANNLLFILAMLGLPWLVVMSSVSMYSPGWLAVLHLVAAAVALGLLASYVFWTSVLSLYLVFRGRGPVVLDSRLSRNARLGMLLFAGVLSLLSPTLFVVWVSDVSRTPIEWAAVVIIYASLLPYFVVFYHARQTPGGYSEVN